MAKVKVRAKAKGGLVDVKCLVSHPMETGNRKDKKTGKKIPAHYIQELTVEANGKALVNGNINSSVSKNPYFRFKYNGAKGDTVKVNWKDNKGETGSGESKVK